ncbi:MAG: hypothetical protein ABH818_01560 [Patescibacteria group bacterium]
MYILNYKSFCKIIISLIILFNIIFIMAPVVYSAEEKSVASESISASPNLKDAFKKEVVPTSTAPTDIVAGRAGYNTGITDPDSIIATVIKAVLSFLGVVFLILIIYAGFTWMTAGGDEEKINKAKDTIQRAIIGLIIILCSYAITIFIFGKLDKIG